MGLLAQAAKTYDLMKSEIGVIKDGKYPLVPLYHVKKDIEIVIQLKESGLLEKVDVLGKDEKRTGIVSSSESAQGRTSGIAPFPLIDNVGYFFDKEKFRAYVAELSKWYDFDPDNSVLKAVHKYVLNNTIRADLERAGVTELDSRKIIGWEIEIKGRNILSWNDADLIQSYTNYFQACNKTKNTDFCMITGKNEIPITNVPVISQFQRAKLISCQETSDFSYKGRFVEGKEAFSIGYDVTQKAINALSWLCGNQSVYLGKSTLLCWNPNGIEVKNPTLPLFDDSEDAQVTYTDYKNALENYIKSKTDKVTLSDRNVITVIFDNPTTGRLSIKFYNELTLDDFLSNLVAWDRECCWFNSREGRIRSPRLSDIMKYAYGIGNNFRTDNKVYESNYPILVERRVSNGRIPTEIVRNLANKCSNLQIYVKDNYWEAERLLFVTCCVLRKYLIDSKVKEYSMALEKDLTDRSYQYGRLLAVFEKIEVDALSGTDTKRMTNAIRMQSMFVRRPGYTSKIILEKLKSGYYSRLSGPKSGALVYYEKLIGEIMSIISSFPISEFDKPLDETYIMGYYLQKNDFYNKKTNDNEEN